MDIGIIAQATAEPEWVSILVSDFLLPIAVAVLAYLAVNQLGEWQKRRMHSRLGIAIIETLQEEIQNGIEIMTEALDAAEDETVTRPPATLLPYKSWSGMSTIPDNVLLRIIQTSKGRQFEGFPPHQCRSHCKNYFEHMCPKYERFLGDARQLAEHGQEWRKPLRNLLADDGGEWIKAAKGVNTMLQNAKGLLKENAEARIPA